MVKDIPPATDILFERNLLLIRQFHTGKMPSGYLCNDYSGRKQP